MTGDHPKEVQISDLGLSSIIVAPPPPSKKVTKKKKKTKRIPCQWL